jgi:hypothetical protein
VSDPIHTSLAAIQSSLTATHKAESADGTVQAEATARHQTALHLTPEALKLPPATLATLILKTQQEAQNKAETALTTHLETFRKDPRVTTALETLQDTQANPTPQQPRKKEDEPEEEEFINSVYNSNNNW